MADLLLPFAKRISDGQFVSAGEVPRGAACNCLCPGCGNLLIARQGTEREWHFAHAKACNCADGYEKSVHELAKQLIRQRKTLLLPAMAAVVSSTDAYGRTVVERQPVFEAKLVHLDECKTSQKRDDVTPDITGRLKDREVLVEVTVFHRLMAEKLDRLVSIRLPSFQIDLSTFKTLQATKDRLEHEIFENPGNRYWLWHPRLEEAKAKAQEKLDARLKEVRQQWEEKEKLRAQSPLPQPTRKVSAPTQPPNQLWDRIWRAGLPSKEQIAAAAEAFTARTTLSEGSILSLAGTIQSRGALVNVTPAALTKQWAQHLQVDEMEVAIFLVEAGYVMIL